MCVAKNISYDVQDCWYVPHKCACSRARHSGVVARAISFAQAAEKALEIEEWTNKKMVRRSEHRALFHLLNTTWRRRRCECRQCLWETTHLHHRTLSGSREHAKKCTTRRYRKNTSNNNGVIIVINYDERHYHITRSNMLWKGQLVPWTIILLYMFYHLPIFVVVLEMSIV